MVDKTALNPADIAALKKEILSSVHCALPGTVESFDAERQTVCVRPAVRRKAGNGTVDLPLVRDVPVFFPGSRTNAVTWPVSRGDECLLVFADLDIDAWFASGNAEEPASGRQHDLSDAFAFVGFRSSAAALPPISDEPSFFGMDPSTSHHVHDAGDVVSGLLPVPRGGSGQAGTGVTEDIAAIATAEPGCRITSAQFVSWGKAAMVRLVITRTSAVESGSTTLCMMAEGKRPGTNSMGQWAWNKGAQFMANGRVMVNGPIAAGESLIILGTYILV